MELILRRHTLVLALAQRPDLTAQLQLGHNLPAQAHQAALLGRIKLARLVVEHAQGTQGKAVRRDQRGVGIEMEKWCADHKIIVLEALVETGVGGDQQRLLIDRVGAKGQLAGSGRHRNAVGGFAPLLLRVDQVDHGDWRLTDLGRQEGQIIKILFRQSPQDRVFKQGRNPALLGGAIGGTHRLPQFGDEIAQETSR